MKKLISFFTALLIEVSILFSQTEYVPGYIIMNNNDTVKGTIFLGSSKVNCEKCRFRQTSKKGTKTYLPGEINSYKFENGLYYRSHEVNVDGAKKYVFLEWAVKGSMNLYFYISHETGIHYFVERGDTGFIELHNSTKEISGPEDTRRIIQIKEYATELASLLRDQPAMFPKISGSTFDSKSLIDLSKEYHALVCPDKQCQIFERPKRQLIVSLGLLIGVDHSSLNMEGISDLQSVIDAFKIYKIKPVNVFEVGALASFSNFDFISRRISLVSELTYSHLDYKLDSYGTIYEYGRMKLAGLIKYSFSLGKFRPNISAGPAFDLRLGAKNYPKYVHVPPVYTSYMPFDKFVKNYIVGINGNAGIDYLLTDKFTLSLIGRYETYGQFLGGAGDLSSLQNINVLLGISYRLK